MCDRVMQSSDPLQTRPVDIPIEIMARSERFELPTLRFEV